MSAHSQPNRFGMLEGWIVAVVHLGEAFSR